PPPPTRPGARPATPCTAACDAPPRCRPARTRPYTGPTRRSAPEPRPGSARTAPAPRWCRVRRRRSPAPTPGAPASRHDLAALPRAGGPLARQRVAHRATDAGEAHALVRGEVERVPGDLELADGLAARGALVLPLDRATPRVGRHAPHQAQQLLAPHDGSLSIAGFTSPALASFNAARARCSLLVADRRTYAPSTRNTLACRSDIR